MGPWGSFGFGIKCMKANPMGLRFWIPRCPGSGCNFAHRDTAVAFVGREGALEALSVPSLPQEAAVAQPFSATCYPGNRPAVCPQDVREGLPAGWVSGREPWEPAGSHTGQSRKMLCWKHEGHRSCRDQREFGGTGKIMPLNSCALGSSPAPPLTS